MPKLSRTPSSRLRDSNTTPIKQIYMSILNISSYDVSAPTSLPVLTAMSIFLLWLALNSPILPFMQTAIMQRLCVNTVQ